MAGSTLRNRNWDRASRRVCALLSLLLCAGTAARGQVLPPPPVVSGGAAPALTAPRLYVKGYNFEGNTVFTDDELGLVTAPFANREIRTDELEEARRAVTLHYINNGYVNSGAVIPDQDPRDGIITLRIVEGALTEINLTGNKWLNDRYITARVERWAGPPLDLTELQEGLQILRQNPNVKQVNAELKPGTTPGESMLDLRVTERQPFRLAVEADNHRPPSSGAEQISILAAHENLTGNSDPLRFRYGVASSGDDGLEFDGVDNLEASYLLPLTPRDLTLGLYGSRLNTSLIEDVFLPLDIESLTATLGVSLRQPIYQTASKEAALGLAFDHRRNTTWLLGEQFSLSPGAVDGEMRVSVLRFSQEWLQRGQNSVLALRSTFNVGLDVLDATDNGVAGDPDATYLSWLGQGQYIRRLFGSQNELLFRLTGQWTTDPLLALEQFSVGGMDTVRGYRENTLVRDRALVSSLELRVPVLFNKAGAGIVHLAPFFDFGGGWNNHDSDDPTTLYSTGIGLLVNPGKHFSAQLYWGHPWREVDVPDDDNAQDLGLHFRVTVIAF